MQRQVVSLPVVVQLVVAEPLQHLTLGIRHVKLAELQTSEAPLQLLFSSPELKVLAPDPIQHLLGDPENRPSAQLGALLEQSADVEQESKSIPPPPDCAIAAVGATIDAITGKATIVASPTFLITSRRDNPAK